MKTANFNDLIDRANNRIFLISFTIFIFVGILATPLITYLFFSSRPQEMVSSLMSGESAVVSYESSWVSDKLASIVSDTRTLASDNYLRAYLDTGSQESLKSFASELVSVSRTKMTYDKIRFLDNKGNELVRVDFKFGSPYIVPHGKLQNKAERYFFTGAMSVKRGEIYMSPLDLNEDNGMVDMPFKPMLRAAIQVYDSHNVKRGIFIINYQASDMLNKLRSMSSTAIGDVMLVNGDGFWLLSKIDDDSWGFQLSERSSRKFQYDFPKEWPRIINSATGQFMSGNGIFTFSTQLLRNSGPQGDRDSIIKIIQHVPQETVSSIIQKRMIHIMEMTVFIFVLSCIPAWIVSRAYSNKKINEEIKDISTHYDPLTKLPNRLSFFNTIETDIVLAHKYNKKFTLLFIDFNEFKQINKLYGIKAGDQLMTTIFEKIIEDLPDKSFVARLKNDDFAIILHDAWEKETIMPVIEQIRSATETTSVIFGKDIKSSINIGAAVFPHDGMDVNSLTSNAGTAVKAAKATEADGLVFYSDLKHNS